MKRLNRKPGSEIKQKLTSFLAVFLFLSAAQIASAFSDPSLGRWLNRDPIEETGFQVARTGASVIQGEKPNLYCFVLNNPVSNADPMGLVPVWPLPNWGTPPGSACDAYNCSTTLKTACNNGGNDSWANCVRGCLLADWNSDKCSYDSGGVARHAFCWCRCFFPSQSPH